MRFAANCLMLLALFLAGCIKLGVTPISAGDQAGAHYVTLQPLSLYGAYGNYPDKTITSYFLTNIGIANRFHTHLGTVPPGTSVEIVDMLDRTALGVPHSRIYRVRLGVESVPLQDSLVEISEKRLLESDPDGQPRLRSDFFRRTN